MVQENPASTAGAIAILTKLQNYIPAIDDDNPLTTLVYGDALSCERHNDAHNARVNSATSKQRLEGVEPSPQEFHKRMLLMQVLMIFSIFKSSIGWVNRTIFIHLKYNVCAPVLYTWYL